MRTMRRHRETGAVQARSQWPTRIGAAATFREAALCGREVFPYERSETLEESDELPLFFAQSCPKYMADQAVTLIL
jgi:hypothetical protein